MAELPLLRDLVVLFTVGVAVVLALGRLRLPPIAGFIVAGVVVGPSGLRLVHDAGQVRTLAEIGVVLLLLSIGLELSLARLKRIWKLVILGGALQVGLTAAATFGVARVLGHPAEVSVLWGFIVASSSTAIVLKALAERSEVDAPHGRLVVGILVFQDLCVVPMLLLVPMLAGAAASPWDIPLVLLKAAAFVAVTLALARFVVPWLLGLVAATRHREVFLLSVMLVAAGIAWITSAAGLSLALGAFLAGLVVADTEYVHQALSDIAPLRDALSSLFFVSVGMLLDVRALLADHWVVLGLFAAVLVGKFVIALVAALAMRFPLRVAALAGVGLSQIGEFSFVLASAGAQAGLLAADQVRRFVAASVVTMLVTPLAMRLGPRLAAGVARLTVLARLFGVRAVEEMEPRHAALAAHVVIAGFGMAGRTLAAALRTVGIPHLILDLNPETVREARAAGEVVYYGDAASPEVLDRAGVRRASQIVVVLSDPDATRRVVAAARAANPDVHIVTRVRYTASAPELLRLGSSEVVPEETEAAIEILARSLRKARVPRNVIGEQVEEARTRGGPAARGDTVPRPTLSQLPHLLAEIKVETFLVRERDWAAGKTLGEARVRTTTRASVVAVRRNGEVRSNPGAEEPMRVGDVLYLLGERVEIGQAMSLLSSGSVDPTQGQRG